MVKYTQEPINKTEDLPGELVTYASNRNAFWVDGRQYGEHTNGKFTLRIKHEPKIPQKSWLRLHALPPGTVVEVRHDLEKGHQYGPYELNNGQERLKGAVITIGAYHIIDGVFTSYMMKQATVNGLRPDYFHWAVPAFNSALLPTGQVIKFPWGNGETCFLAPLFPVMGETDLEGTMHALPKYTVGPFKKLEREDLQRLRPGDIIRSTDNLHIIVKVAEDDIRAVQVHAPYDPMVIPRVVDERIMFTTDTEIVPAGNATTINQTLAWTYIGHVDLPNLIQVGEPVPYKDLNPGDIIVSRSKKNGTIGPVSRHKMIVRSVARDDPDGYRLRFDHYYAETTQVDTTVDRIHEWGSMSEKIYDVFVIDRKGFKVPNVRDAASEEDWQEFGVTIRPDGMDKRDYAMFKQVFTKTLLKHLKSIGIHTIIPYHDATHEKWDGTNEMDEGVLICTPTWGPEAAESREAWRTASFGNIERSRKFDVDIERAPEWVETQNIFASLTFDSGVRAFVYWPEIKHAGFVHRPFNMGTDDVLYFRSLFNEFMNWTRQMHAEIDEKGGIDACIKDFRVKNIMQRIFGINDMPKKSELIFGHSLMSLTAAKEGETPDVIILGTPYRIKKRLENVDNRVKAVLGLLDNDKTFGRAALEMHLKQVAQGTLAKVKEQVIDPHEARARAIVDEAKTEMAEKATELRTLQKKLLSETSKTTEVLRQYGRAFDIIEGIVKSALPMNARWYTRIVEGGYVECCIDEVEWADVNNKWKCKTPVQLRIRFGMDPVRNVWTAVPYTEAPLALIADPSRVYGTQSNLNVHPHLFHHDPRVLDGRIAGEYHDPALFPGLDAYAMARAHIDPKTHPEEWKDYPRWIRFCFGGVDVRVPHNRDLVGALKELREYLAAIDRVLYSVSLPGGTDGNHGLFRSIMTGHTTSEVKLSTMMRHYGWTQDAARPILEWAERHRAAFKELQAKCANDARIANWKFPAAEAEEPAQKEGAAIAAA